MMTKISAGILPVVLDAFSDFPNLSDVKVSAKASADLEEGLALITPPLQLLNHNSLTVITDVVLNLKIQKTSSFIGNAPLFYFQ